jgi:hypothetical protein
MFWKASLIVSFLFACCPSAPLIWRQPPLALRAGGISSRLNLKPLRNFLRAYVGGIQPVIKDARFAEQSFAKWLRERDAIVVKNRWMHTRLFKTMPYVAEKGIENILKDLAPRRAIPKEFIGRPELFGDNAPLERALSSPS